MMKQQLSLLLLFTVFTLSAQVDYYSDNVLDCIETIQDRADSLAKVGSIEESGKLVFESIPKDCIIGKTFHDYVFTSLTGATLDLGQVDKPILLKVSASWCKPCMAEIDAINRIAEKYRDSIVTVILFWDHSEGLKKLAERYNEHILLIPSTERLRETSFLSIDEFNHYLGFPASYYLNPQKKVVAMSRGASAAGAKRSDGTVIQKKEADQLNYDRFNEQLIKMLKNKD